MNVLPFKTMHLTLAAGLLLAAAGLWIDLLVFTMFKVMFILVAPGMMLMRLCRLPLSRLEFCALALVMGLAINTVIATAAIYADYWFPPLIYCWILCLTTALLIIDLWRDEDVIEDNAPR